MKLQAALAICVPVLAVGIAQTQTGIWMGAGPGPRTEAVKNAPFSADLVTITDHAKGQPGITTEFHGKVARNANGASYYAMEFIRPTPDPTRPMRVLITDPAAHTITTLDQHSKTAYVSHVSASVLQAAPLLTPGSSAPSSDGKPAGPTAIKVAGQDVKTESLGTREIAGIQTVGIRTIRTIPANGPSDKPFVSMVDTWSSPELKVIVLNEVHTSGGDHHITRLENIVRTEPSEGLFQVPAGYTVRNNAPVANNMY
jgi:hypothetical protein